MTALLAMAYGLAVVIFWLALVLPCIRLASRAQRRHQRRAERPLPTLQTRRVRAGPICEPQPLPTLAAPSYPVTDYLAAARRAQIARDAAACAHSDFALQGRPRANPHRRHSRAYAVWAMEYTLQWEAMARCQAGEGLQP